MDMLVYVTNLAEKLDDSTLWAIVDEFNDARDAFAKCGCEETRFALFDARIELKDAYEEYRR